MGFITKGTTSEGTGSATKTNLRDAISESESLRVDARVTTSGNLPCPAFLRGRMMTEATAGGAVIRCG